MTMNEARAALNVPTSVANVNVVQDGAYRLREALALAGSSCRPDEEAPSYVTKAVAGLHAWIEFATARAA